MVPKCNWCEQTATKKAVNRMFPQTIFVCDDCGSEVGDAYRLESIE